MLKLLLTCGLVLGVSGAEEPPARLLKAQPIRVGAGLAHVSAVREIGTGRLLLSNAKGPSVLLVDIATGTVTQVGAAGGGADRYASPGGLYAGPNATTLLLDRGQMRVFTISATGELLGSRSIARRGVTESSDVDADRQRIDANGLAYFVDRHAPGAMLGAKASTLVRFDADTQKSEPVATLRNPEVRTIPAGDGLTLGRQVVGSPADGWGVAPDGRVAIVRADPYRVEWHAPEGQVTSGPVVEYTPLAMTEADKKRFASNRGGGRVSIGQTGSTGADLSKLELLFASTKPAFDPEGVLVSPDSRVWVLRTAPAEATSVTYDVFDTAGRRVDRIALADGDRIVGFGPSAVYARHVDTAGRSELRRYGLKR